MPILSPSSLLQHVLAIYHGFGASTITVTIPFEKSGFDKRNAAVNATVKLIGSERAVFDLAASDPSVTADELVRATQKHRTTVIRALSRLKEKEIAERVGSDKNGAWIIRK